MRAVPVSVPFCGGVLQRVALFLLCSTLGAAAALAADPKPGRYAGTMTVTYRSHNTGELGVANKVTCKVSGEGNPSSDPATPGIVLYLMAPPQPGEIVPSHGKITSINFRASPPSITYVDPSNNPVTYVLPQSTLPIVKGNSITLPEIELGSVTIAGFRYEYSMSFRVRRVP